MFIHLLAGETALRLAHDLCSRVVGLLPSTFDAAAVHLYTAASEPRSGVALLLVDAAELPAALRACALLREKAPQCTLLAAGEPAVHAALGSFVQAGAADLICLPVSDAELTLRLGLAAAPPARRSDGEATPAQDVPIDPRLRHVIARSPSSRALLRRLPMLAEVDASVLILGETGTGKEVFAQALHYLSPRASKPWVPINCGAVPVDLFESELFGHVRGAYTSAGRNRVGLVEEAHGGTLFLDDVDCLPVPVQSKLLRLLQEREYRPVGSNALQHADVRVVAASNRELNDEAARGAFRSDLYYRLNVVSLRLPPLRSRREDIDALALHFVDGYARQFRKPLRGLTAAASRRLAQQAWPGNVRELQHVIERSVLLSTGASLLDEHELVLDETEAPPLPPAVSFKDAKARVVLGFEREYIEELLARCDGNVSRAARQAGKHRRAFFELMRKHGIKSASAEG